MNKAITAALGAAAIVGMSIVGTGTANATADPMVCVGIEDSSSYMDYLIDAAVWGKAFNWDTKAQAKNIVDSVVVYCPQHLSGLLAAANAVTGKTVLR